jgi:hypothetical protein
MQPREILEQQGGNRMYNYNMYEMPSADELIEYLRKSRQDDPNETVEEVIAKHKQEIDEWVEENIGEPVAEDNIYMERVSGETIKEREEIRKVLKRIESPKIKAVAVYDIPRLSRGDLEDAGRIINAFRYSNTLIIALKPMPKIYDARIESDRMLLEMKLKEGNAFLEYTKSILAGGRDRAVKNGSFIGMKAPLGYRKITVGKCKTLEPDENAWVVKRMYEMYAYEGQGRRNICNWLESIGIPPSKGKYWSPETVSYILSNPNYLGKIRWNHAKTVKMMKDGEIVKKRVRSTEEAIIVDGLHEPIISEKLFNDVQEVCGKKPKIRDGKRMRNPLAGLVYCSSCGYAMIVRQYTTKTERKHLSIICPNQHNCTNGSISLQYVIDDIVELLADKIEDFEIKLKNDDGQIAKDHAILIQRIKDNLAELELKEIAQWRDKYDGKIPEAIFEKLNSDLLEKKNELQNSLCIAENNMPEAVDYEEKIVRFSDALETLKDEDAPVELKNDLLKKCIERIDYTREKAKGVGATDKRDRPMKLEVTLRI